MDTYLTPSPTLPAGASDELTLGANHHRDRDRRHEQARANADSDPPTCPKLESAVGGAHARGLTAACLGVIRGRV